MPLPNKKLQEFNRVSKHDDEYVILVKKHGHVVHPELLSARNCIAG